MKRRRFGRAAIEVSEVGLGGHREGVETGVGVDRNARFFLPAAERASLVARAIELGVNYFDTTYGCEIASLGESLRICGGREGAFVSAMRVDFFKNLPAGGDVRAYTRREVECRLREFGFDHVEQFMLGAVHDGDPLSGPRSVVEDALEELGRLREAGKLRFIGFSCHEPDYAARFLRAFPAFDAVMVPYNFANRVAEGELAAAVGETGAAWIAMKTMVWHVYGIPVTALRHLPRAAEAAASIGRPALQFVLSHPRLTTCVPAVNTTEAVEENVSASEAGELSERDRQRLAVCVEIMSVDDHVPLAIAGLMEDNLRVRSNAISHITRALELPTEAIDGGAPDAEARARAVAEAILARLRTDDRWSHWLA